MRWCWRPGLASIKWRSASVLVAVLMDRSVHPVRVANSGWVAGCFPGEGVGLACQFQDDWQPGRLGVGRQSRRVPMSG